MHELGTCRTLPEVLRTRAQLTPDAPAFCALDAHSRWQSQRWADVATAATQLGLALAAAGIHKGDRVAILAPTSIDWELAQQGALSIGAIVVGIDPHLPPPQLEQVLRLVDPAALFVQDSEAWASVASGPGQRIAFAATLADLGDAHGPPSLSSLRATGAAAAGRVASTAPDADDAAVMVLSSGSTGTPKAVVYTHRQVLLAMDAILAAFPDIGPHSCLLCWLPLANLFQRVINFCAIGCGARSYVLSDPRQLMEHIGTVQPHLLIGVPRLYERMHAGIMARLQALPALLRGASLGLLRLAQRRALDRLDGRRSGWTTELSWQIAERLLLRRLRRILGARLRFVVSGSAPMPLWLLQWFEGIGLPVLEAYGISENIVPVAISLPTARKLGSCGRPLSATQVRLAADGEILLRGAGVCHGYFGADTQDLAALSVDGYRHSGDLGHLDAQGYLYLLGRKAEVFKSAGGQWIRPAPLEERLRRIAYIDQALILPLAGGTVAAILAADPALLPEALRAELETCVHSAGTPLSVARLRADVDATLADLPAWQRPAAMLFSATAFSIASGELTTNLKLRRHAIAARHAVALRRLETALLSARETGEPAAQPAILST